MNDVRVPKGDGSDDRALGGAQPALTEGARRGLEQAMLAAGPSAAQLEQARQRLVDARSPGQRHGQIRLSGRRPSWLVRGATAMLLGKVFFGSVAPAALATGGSFVLRALDVPGFTTQPTVSAPRGRRLGRRRRRPPKRKIPTRRTDLGPNG